MRQRCSEVGALLIFDEVISGFRVHPGGAQGYYGIKPDLTTLAKILAGGFPGVEHAYAIQAGREVRVVVQPSVVTDEQAQALAVPGSVQADLLEASALVPLHPQRIDDPTTVARLRVRIDGVLKDLSEEFTPAYTRRPSGLNEAE